MGLRRAREGTVPAHWKLWLSALAVSLAFGWIDSLSYSNDGALVEVVALFLASGVFGWASQKRTWVPALLIGGGIPLFHVRQHDNLASRFAIVISLVGCYAGVAARYIFSSTSPK